MKFIILLFSIVAGGYILFSKPSHNYNISGTWVMQGKKDVDDPAVLRIEMGKGFWEGKLDMPGQELYNHEIYSIISKQDSVFINLFKGGTVINAALVNDSTLAGEMLLEDKSDTIIFSRR